MIQSMWQRVLALFGKKSNFDNSVTTENERYVNNYEDSKDINFTAIFSNKFANYTVSDSNIEIIGDSARAKDLQKVIKKLRKKMKKIVARGLGVGGVLAVPYVANKKIYFNIITQNRFHINKKIGDEIVDCTFLAEHIVKDQKNYYRWADYTLDNNALYIKYRATLESTPISLETIEQWGNITDFAITNVEKMPFMFLKSPVDNRQQNDDYGVPITFGCDKQINKIRKTLDQIEREFDLKEVFVCADSTMFNGKNGLSKNGLYKMADNVANDFWQVFDPSYREEPLFKKLVQQCALLEKMISASEGVITKVETFNATATQIKKMLKDTFDLVDDIRDNLEEGLEDFLYGCNVLSNYFKITPQGENQLKTDWSYDLIEDTQESYRQLIDGLDRNIIKQEEVRQFIKPDEDLETAKEKIKEIKQENPTVKDLLGE